ncbi:uncharacterized protein LOC100368310 [Saccoglossus kowalevskii]|uniref:Uncharacterized protein LOC100368310 n=1 Tax=Saccoglossus kowalevskii TaxID=10224 RepID=A0ABM0H1M4_SACKO|nr:PREDICTED: uncharacterized protein LOC100368310 [Saccoglossus kowalevskii]
MNTGLGLFTFVVFTRTAYCLWPYSFHASCKIDWSFGLNCTHVNTEIVSQIKKWKGPDNCEQGGQKCLYELIFSNETFIQATHTTPVKKYIDDMTFHLQVNQKTCSVQGNSESRVWYAVLDYGTNYCNLHNIIEGAGLDKAPGYSEDTADKICTQYTSANCEVY